METQNQQAGTELDFGAGRRLEQQVAMRQVLKSLETTPFSGQRLKPGEVSPIFTSPADAQVYYRKALIDFVTGLGAKVRVPSALLHDDFVMASFGSDDGIATGDKTVQHFAPFETVVLTGMLPGNARGGAAGQAQIIEACAELMRVMLGTAIVGAFEDCDKDEVAVVYFRTEPEFDGKTEFDTGKGVAIGRMRVIVYTETEPRVSYLLGSVYGRKKPFQFAWEFPMVEQVYGPNRLRWNDLRSPGYEPAAVPADVVPS